MYCLVNFQAVVGFLLTVDVESLGLDSDKILEYVGHSFVFADPFLTDAHFGGDAFQWR